MEYVFLYLHGNIDNSKFLMSDLLKSIKDADKSDLRIIEQLLKAKYVEQILF